MKRILTVLIICTLKLTLLAQLPTQPIQIKQTKGTNPSCEGQEITLTTTPTVFNGIWTEGPNCTNPILGFGSSITFTPTKSVTYGHWNSFSSTPCQYSVKAGGLSITIIPTVGPSGLISGSTNVCKGQNNVTYTVSSIPNATTYEWTLPSGVTGTSTTNTITVNYGVNAISGNISVKGKNQCGFGSSSSLLVTVNSSPSPPSLSKDTIICEYQNLNLNVNSNEDVNYEWTGPNGFYSSLKNPLVSSSFNEQIAGTYSVQVVSNGCKSLPSSIEVKINKSKATVKNSCEGGKLELFASTIPGANYFWTGPNGFTSTLQNPFIDSVKSLNSSGTYMVYTTVNNCTSPVPGEVNVSVFQIPVPTGVVNNGPLCVGKILSLRTDSIPGATYLWTGPNGFTSTLRNPIVSTNFSTSMIGSYNLSVSLNGCTSLPLTSNVELNKTSASSLPVCVGGDFKLTASNVTGAVYNWTGPNGFTSSLQNPIVSSNATTAMTGVYSVKSIVNGCESPISSIIVSVNQSVSLPTVTENLVYCQNEIASKLNATGVNLKWYFQKEGGNPQLEAPLPLTQSYGKTSYFVTQTTICESKRAEIKVTVVPTSKIFFDGLNAICSGSSKKLIAPVIEGMSFQWKKNGVAISGATDSTLMVNSAGSYSLSTSLGSACKSDAPAVSISVETAPSVTISGPSKICWNGRAMFRASVAPGVWAPVDNTLILASPQGLFRNSVKPATDNFKSGISYTVSSKLGACTTKVTKNVYVRNVIAPSVTISTLKSSIKVNESTTATATTAISSTGTWSSTNTLVSAIANPLNTKTATVKGLRVGSGANVVYFADDATTGCRNAGYLAYSVTAAASMVSVSTNSETATSNISLYPNPSNGKFTLNSTEDLNSVKLIDISGRVIAVRPINSGTTTIDFTGVSSGKYMLQITGDQVNEMQPIVIE